MWSLLIAGVAFAAEPDVMVHVDYAVRTPPVVVFTETTPLGTANPTRTRLVADTFRFNGGFGAQLGTKELGRHGTLILDAGLYGWSARWFMEPDPFTATVWEGRVDIGTRQDIRMDRHRKDLPIALGYGIAGIGAQLTVFSSTWWPAHLNPALHGFGGLGLSIGGERVRVLAELRGSLAARLDFYQGRAERSEDQLGWTYFPGSIGVTTLVGLHFP
jgi:hypothetical protein